MKCCRLEPECNGLLELFADRRFSEAWTVKWSERV